MSAPRSGAAAADAQAVADAERPGAEASPASGACAAPQLVLVRKPVARAGRTPFALLVLLLAGAGLVGLLLVNTRLQEGAVLVTRLDRENQVLRERAESLAQAVELAAAPQRLAESARAAGMVPGPAAAALRLSDGAVIGEAVVATDPVAEAAAAAAAAQAAAEQAAAEAAAQAAADQAAAEAAAQAAAQAAADQAAAEAAQAAAAAPAAPPPAPEPAPATPGAPQ